MMNCSAAERNIPGSEPAGQNRVAGASDDYRIAACWELDL